MVMLLQAQINIVLAILLIILVVHAYFNMNRKKKTNKLIIYIIGLVGFTLILEAVSVVLNNSELKQFMVLQKLVNIIGFIVAPYILFLGYLFCKEWINRYHEEKIKVNKLFILPLLVNGIAALMSYNGNGIFRITSENIYERGSLFFISPLVSFIYFAYNLYFIFKQRKNLPNSELFMFSIFYIVPALFNYIQIKYYVYLTTWNSTAIIIVITYIFILNDQAYRDSLTGLQNRLSYEHYSQNIYHKKLNRLHIVYIDIDDFKTINDQYGHYEGDEAIKAFANLLRVSFPLSKSKLIRLGGDEFLIILEEKNSENISKYIQGLIKNVETFNNSEKKPYKLKFSYGSAFYTNSHINMYQLLEKADKLMYEQKQNRNVIL